MTEAIYAGMSKRTDKILDWVYKTYEDAEDIIEPVLIYENSVETFIGTLVASDITRKVKIHIRDMAI